MRIIAAPINPAHRAESNTAGKNIYSLSGATFEEM
jgi:hypothetical protein